MSAAEKRIKLIVEWIESHPGTLKNVKKKMAELATAHMRATFAIKKNIPAGAAQEASLKSLEGVYEKHRSQIMRNILGYKLYQEAMEGMKTRTQAAAGWMGKWGAKVQKTGRQVGIYGFIVSYALRQIMRISRQLFTFFKQLFKISADFGAALEKVSFGAALLESQGLATSETLDFLADAQDSLVEYGPTLMALWEGFEAVFTAAAVSIMVKLIPSLTELLDRLAEILAREDVQDMIVALIDAFIELAHALLDAAPEILEMAQYFTDLLVSATPLIRVFAPMIPVILALGAAMFLLGPIFSVVGALMQVISVVMSVGLVPILGMLLPIIIAVTAAILVFATVFKVLSSFMDPAHALIIAIVAAIVTFIAVLWLILPLFAGLGAAGTAAAPGIVAVGGAVGAAGAAATPAIPIILALGVAILMAGAGFLLAGVGVMLAVDALIKLAQNLKILIPLVPVVIGLGAGLFVLAAAGIAMLPGAVGVLAMSVSMLALSVSMVALTAALWGLVAAAEAFEAAGGVVKDIVGGITGGINALGNALGALCFKHATPMAEEFAKTLTDVQGELVGTQMEVKETAEALKKPMRGAIGVEGELGEGIEGGPQEITIYSTVTIENVTGIADLDLVEEAANRGIGEALRRRRP